MSGSFTYSQTGIPASITMTPGPGVLLGGALPGRGYVSAAIGVDGRLRLLASDGTVEDLGPVAPTVARVQPAGGGDNATSAPITASTTIIVAPASPGGAVRLTAGGAFILFNRSGADQPLYPSPGGAFEQQATGASVVIPNGAMTVLTSTPDALQWSMS